MNYYRDRGAAADEDARRQELIQLHTDDQAVSGDAASVQATLVRENRAP